MSIKAQKCKVGGSGDRDKVEPVERFDQDN